MKKRVDRLARDYAHVIIDTPPGELDIVRAALHAAEITVVAISPSVVDINRFRLPLELIVEVESVMDLEYRVLLTMVRRISREGRDARQVMEVVNRSPKPSPEKVLRIWAREWFKEGREKDLGKLPKRPAFENLPRRWVAEHTFAWIYHNRRMSKDHERLSSSGEAFIHAAMTRLMVRRLARA